MRIPYYTDLRNAPLPQHVWIKPGHIRQRNHGHRSTPRQSQGQCLPIIDVGQQEDQTIIDYLIPDPKYHNIWIDIILDINARNEPTYIMVLAERFIKIVLITHQFTPEEEAIFTRRTLGRFKNLTNWILGKGHLVPEGTQFPFTEDE